MKISICSMCCNRENNLFKSWSSWKKSKANEIIVLDYGSEKPIKGAFRVEEKPFSMTKANNISIGLSTGDLIIKADSDHFFNYNFLNEINLKEGEFISGQGVKNWVDGFCIFWKKDFEKVNGYNERLKHYGWDDIDFYNRLEGIGLKHRRINPNWITHLDHSNQDRLKAFGFEGRRNAHLDWCVEQNKKKCAENPWTNIDRRSKYEDF